MQLKLNIFVIYSNICNRRFCIGLAAHTHGVQTNAPGVTMEIKYPKQFSTGFSVKQPPSIRREAATSVSILFLFSSRVEIIYSDTLCRVSPCANATPVKRYSTVFCMFYFSFILFSFAFNTAKQGGLGVASFFSSLLQVVVASNRRFISTDSLVAVRERELRFSMLVEVHFNGFYEKCNKQ